MPKNEEVYSPYFEHNKTIAHVLSLFSGFIFTSITLLLTRLSNTEDALAQATLLFLTILFYVSLFVLIDNLEMPFHYIKNIPPRTLKVRLFLFVSNILFIRSINGYDVSLLSLILSLINFRIDMVSNRFLEYLVNREVIL